MCCRRRRLFDWLKEARRTTWRTRVKSRKTAPHCVTLGTLKPAAAVEALAVDRDLNLVGIGAVAHSVAALRMDDVHVDPRRVIDFARDPDDDLRGGLLHRLLARKNEGDVM